MLVLSPSLLYFIASSADCYSWLPPPCSLQLDKDLALILSLEKSVGRWTLVALEIKWKVTESSFCPKKAALDMECHRQLFLPHHRTCYKDSPTWVEIMPPIPAPKYTRPRSIVQGGRAGKHVLFGKGMQNTGTTTFFCMMPSFCSVGYVNRKRQEGVEWVYTHCTRTESSSLKIKPDRV